MNQVCADDDQSCCPFAWTEASEQVQGYGCLPTPHEIKLMRVNHGKTWACHQAPDKPCVGAIQYLKDNNLPHQVIDPILVTEDEDWSVYI